MNGLIQTALFRIAYPAAVCRKPDNKNIHLTFDDGPDPEATPRILEILKQYRAKATFFCVGRQAEKYSSLYGDILAHGHLTGNHTYSHLNGWKTSTPCYLDDVERCTHVVPSQYFRPPYGKMSRGQYRRLRQRYRIVMWDIMPGDFSLSVSAETCLKRAISRCRPGSIIVFHDSKAAMEKMTYALPRFLEHFGGRGYEFVSLVSRKGFVNFA